MYLLGNGLILFMIGLYNAFVLSLLSRSKDCSALARLFSACISQNYE